MDLRVLRLIGGEDVVAMVERSNEQVILKNPVQLIMTGEGVAMMSFSPYSETQQISIKENYVIFMLEPDQNVKNAYNSQFGTGIITPPKGLQL